MSYQIRKGWPSNAAVDVALTADDDQDIKDGDFVVISDSFKCSHAAYSGSELYAFIIGKERLHGTMTGLMSTCVIELDQAHYADGETFTVNQDVTINDEGKLTGGDSDTSVGKVLAYDSTNGNVVILFHAAH